MRLLTTERRGRARRGSARRPVRPSAAGPAVATGRRGVITDVPLGAQAVAASATSARRDGASAAVSRVAIRTPGRPSGGHEGDRPTARPSARRSRRAGSQPRRSLRIARRSAATAKIRPTSSLSASVRSSADAMCGLGQQQDVGRRSRRDVADRQDEVVLVDLGRWDLAGDDAAEQAVGRPSEARLRAHEEPDDADQTGHQVRHVALASGAVQPDTVIGGGLDARSGGAGSDAG